ncbi:MAG: alpha-ketoacid dehydrogenase subunit beta [Candidatus Aerophobetes bacterium]
MREITYSQALNEALREEMQGEERVFIIGEDIAIHGGTYNVSKGLLREFGEKRVKDTPISEAAIVGLGVGAALTGLRPVVEIMYIDFVTVAMDQIVNQAAKLRYMTGGTVKLPMVIRTQGGSGTGEAAQHTQSLEAWFIHIPGLKVVMPSCPYDAKGLFKTAIRDDNPVIFIDHKLLFSKKGPVPEDTYTIPLGEADIKKEGEDVTVVATSLMVHKVLAAARKLEGQGISLEVIDPRTLLPLDKKTIVSSVKKTHRLMIVHEAYSRGGIGSIITEEIMEEVFDFLDAPIKVLAGKNAPIPYSPPLEKVMIPQEEDIICQIREWCS